MKRGSGRLAVLLATLGLWLAPACGGRVDLLLVGGEDGGPVDGQATLDASHALDAGGHDGASIDAGHHDGGLAEAGIDAAPDGPTCTKACSGVCVGTNDPAHGCAAASCGPCPAHSVCLGGACASDCGSLSDCNGACVDEQTDPGHCGGCNSACPSAPNATAKCSGGKCTFACDSGFHVCASTSLCEDDTSPATCGTSCVACPAPANATATCSAGQCGYTCAVGYTVCSAGCCTCGNTQSDPKNCGYCGHDCLGQSCVAGVCTSVVVANMQANAAAIAVDETNVYWTTTGTTGAISRAALSGGAPTVLTSSSTLYPGGITVDAQNVYFTNDYPGGAVMSVPIAGGTVKTVLGNLDSPQAITIDTKYLYFTLNPYQNPTGGAVMHVLPSGALSATLAQGQNQPISIAVGASSVLWTNQTDVMTVPLAGGNPVAIEPQQYPYAVAVDAQHVYWTAGINGGVVMQASLGGGSPITLASGQYYPNAIAVDGTSVYWTTGQGGTGAVMKVAIGGGTAVPLATGQAYPIAIALNSTHVFWVDFGDGTIRSVPK